MSNHVCRQQRLRVFRLLDLLVLVSVPVVDHMK